MNIEEEMNQELKDNRNLKKHQRALAQMNHYLIYQFSTWMILFHGNMWQCLEILFVTIGRKGLQLVCG
jgi:hypothetical protein